MRASKAYNFIGHVMTLNIVESRRDEILSEIESGLIDWDNVVKLASDQFVLPLLYIKFRDSKLLNSLPRVLSDHLKMIYDLNVKRNKELIDQAKEIAECLSAVNIKPVFIKGMANILGGLYIDLGERMMLDIDFLVDENEIEKAAQELKKIGYVTYSGNMFWDKSTKHYPRLTNSHRISDIELHFRPASKEACIDFGLSDILETGIEHGLYVIPDNSNSLKISFLHSMIDNKGFKRKEISLRDLYDLLLFSQTTDLSVEMNFSAKQEKFFGAYLYSAQFNLGLNNLFTTNSSFRNRRFLFCQTFSLDNKAAILVKKSLHFFLLNIGKLKRITRYQ